MSGGGEQWRIQGAGGLPGPRPPGNNMTTWTIPDGMPPTLTFANLDPPIPVLATPLGAQATTVFAHGHVNDNEFAKCCEIAPLTTGLYAPDCRGLPSKEIPVRLDLYLLKSTEIKMKYTEIKMKTYRNQPRKEPYTQ